MRRVVAPDVGLHNLLDVRQTLASCRQMLHERGGEGDGDAQLTFDLDRQILQVDELHRSMTSDNHAFKHRSTLQQSTSQKAKGAKKEYSSKVIVTAVQSCTLLRDSSDLEKQMRHSVQLLFPQQASELSTAIDRGLLKAPGPTQVSRWRLAVDVGFMMVMRSLFRESRGHTVRALLCDSSPQCGFDWLLTEIHGLSPIDYEKWTKDTWRLIQTRERWDKLVRSDDPSLDGELRCLEDERKKLQADLEALGTARHPTSDVHLMPPAATGSRRSQVVHKVHALLHCLRLEIGEWPAVADFLATIRAVTTDFGTESGLCDVQNVDLSLLFQWASAAGAIDFEQQGLGSDVPATEAEAAPEHPFLQSRDGNIVLPKLFPLAVQIPGALHILHHSLEELTSAFQAYESWFLPGLQAVVSRVPQRALCKLSSN